MMNFQLSKLLLPKNISRLIIISVLLLLVGFSAIPSYLTSKWQWQKPPLVTNLAPIRALLEDGLDISGWETSKQVEARIGSYRWSIQLLEKDNYKPVTLLLRPLRGHEDKPEVDWMDLRGFEGWRSDLERKLEFTSDGGAKVTANFFRGRTRAQTLAVLQWYASPNGGNPSPAVWFWQDQWAQLQGKRVPWVAVCIAIPVKPLGNFEENLTLAESLAKTVQNALMETFST